MSTYDSKGRLKLGGLPIGAIAPFYGFVLPTGWLLCDGTLGTPDLTVRVILGDVAAGVGTATGVRDPSTGLTHTGLAVADHPDHVVTQCASHPDHVVTQPSAHSSHVVTQCADHGAHSSAGGHPHNAHTTAFHLTGASGTEFTGPVTHSTDGAHTHDAHSSHSGMAVDAHSAHSGMTVDAHSAHAFTVDSHTTHSVTQQGAHSAFKTYKLGYIIKVS